MMKRAIAVAVSVALFADPALPYTGQLNTGVAPATSSVPTVEAVSGATALQSAATGNGNGTAMLVTGYNSAGIYVNCSVACSGGTTITFQGTVDGTNYFSVVGFPLAGGSGVTTATTSGAFLVNTSGLLEIRSPISSYSAGTITVTAIGAAGGASIGGSGGGTVAQGNPQAIPADAWLMSLYGVAGDFQADVNSNNQLLTYDGHSTGTGGSDLTAFSVAPSGAGLSGWSWPSGCTPNANSGELAYWQCIALGIYGPIAAGSSIIGGTIPSAGVGYGPTPFRHYSLATSGGDANNLKASPGTLYSLCATQTTTTAMEVKLYNLTTTPTCSSGASVVGNQPVQANTIGPGACFPIGATGMNFSVGIGYCIVAQGSPISDTDAGTPAAGLVLNGTYK